MKPRRYLFLSFFAPGLFKEAEVKLVYHSFNDFHDFGNLRDIDFALSCMDVLVINAQISIN